MKSINPFAKISTVNDAETIINKAQKQAMQSSIKGTGKHVNPVIKARRKETKRIENYAKNLRDSLERIINEFPRVEKGEIHDFYIDMVGLLIDLDEFHRVMGSIKGIIPTIWKITRKYVSDIWHMSEPYSMKQHRRAAFRRIESITSQLDDRLKKLEQIRQIIRLLPAFDFDELIICIAGIPNAGKSSFVSLITTASPAIGEYPFTTKKASLGHYTSTKTHRTCQVVDTPGVLDRPLKERNEIEQKAFIAIKNVPNAIIFLIDPTEEYPLESQVNLAVDIKNYVEEDLWVAISKIDLLSDEQLDVFKTNLSTQLKNKLNYDKELFTITTKNPQTHHELIDSVLTEMKLPSLKM